MTYTRKLRITIGNKSYDVTVEDLTDGESYRTPAPSTAHPAPSLAPTMTGSAAAKARSLGDLGTVTSPMAGTIKSVLVQAGDHVRSGQALVVLEAMKMENQITAPVSGTVKVVHVKPGDSVPEGQVLLVLE